MDVLRSGLFVLLFLFSAALFANMAPDLTSLGAQSFPTPTTDEMLVKELQQQMQQSQFLATLNMDVHSQDGFVVLAGVADSDEQVNTIVLLFMGTSGVKDVQLGNVLVKNKRITNQDVLVAKINGLLMREQIFEKDYVIKPIEVYAQQGNVTLLGIVEKQKQEKEIVNLVKSVNGVQNVESKIVTLEAYRRKK